MISNGLSHRNQHKMLGEVYVHKWKFFNRDRMGEYHSAKRKTYFEKATCLQQLSYRVNIIFPLEKVFSH